MYHTEEKTAQIITAWGNYMFRVSDAPADMMLSKQYPGFLSGEKKMLLGSWHFYSLFYFNEVTAVEWNIDISLVNEKERSAHFWESKQKSCF